MAWFAILLASTLPMIIGSSLPDSMPNVRSWASGFASVQIGGLMALITVTWLRPAARVMFWPLMSLLAFVIGWRGVTPLVLHGTAWVDWQSHQSIGMSLVTSRLQWLPPIILMVFVAWRARWTRRELFLMIGDWSAPIERDPLFPLRNWSWFPTMFMTFLIVGWVSVAPTWAVSLKPDYGQTGRLLEHWPGIVTGAALNAAAEELVFRMLLLPGFIQAFGRRQALLLAGFLFGIEHWETSGIGVLLACYGGWIFAKSMTDTGGCSWALVQHILGDIPIYALVAIARP